MTTVVVFMVADLFHVGHLNLLRQAKALGDYLIVGILTDDAVRRYKGKPVIPYEERAEIVKQCKYVDEIVLTPDFDPTETLKTLNADILVHGDDWTRRQYMGATYMESIGKKAVLVSYYPHQSTTKIKERIRNGR